jgi:hypothetical protein
MKTLLRLTYFAILYGLLTLASPAATGAPYFHIPGDQGETSDEQFPLIFCLDIQKGCATPRPCKKRRATTAPSHSMN